MTAIKGVISDNNVVVEDKLDLYNGKSVIVTILDFRPQESENKSLNNMHVSFYPEDDGSVTGVLEELDLIENSKTREKCIDALIDSMKDYANDFSNDFEFWGTSKNRQSHIPYVMKILSSDKKEIERLLICQDGQN